MNGAGVIWVFALMFLICADIIGLQVFGRPIRGVPEMVSLSLVACVFLQIAFAVRRQRLTRAEIVIGRLEQRSPAAAGTLNGCICAVGAVMFVLIAIGAWPDLLRAIRTREFAGAVGMFTVQVWPIKLLVVVGAVVAALEMLRQLIVNLKAGAGHAAGADDDARGRWAFGVEAARPDYAGDASVRSHERRTQESPSGRWRIALLPIALIAVVLSLVAFGAEPRTTGLVLILITLVLIATGMPIAIALLLVGFLGLGLIRESFTTATRALSLAAEGTIAEYLFVAVPLFVLMGLFVNVSDIGRDAFRAAQQVFGRIRGGLGVATVAANAMFAAITGISIASAAIFAKIAVPEMVRQGYTAKFAVGLTAGSSVLGMLIPPSLLLIIFGVVAEVSIGALFIAAVIPGILLAAAFALGVILMARFAPGFVGDAARPGASGRGEVGAADDGTGPDNGWRTVVIGLWPVLALIVLVLGGIYSGFFTPTEAGAVGAFAAMCFAVLKRRLSWARLWEVICETGQVSVVILFLIMSASLFSQFLTLTGLPADLAGFMSGAGLGIAGFLAIYLLLLIVLGTVLDATSTMLILLPLALPVAGELGVNLIWFGIITVIGVEIGLLTPPLGLSVYVIKSSVDDQRITLGTIFAGAFPFVLITFFVALILMLFPWLSLALL
jgi:C4-dicarboxylate transporter, DctM subunit